MQESFEATIKLHAQYYYNKTNNWAIYAVTVEESEKMESIEFRHDETIVIKGSMPELDRNSTYIAKLTPKKDAKYGMGYDVSHIYSKPMSSRDEISAFLQTILTAKQAFNILEAYPNENVIELIKNDKFDYAKVHGIGDKIFQNIKEKIIANEMYQKAIIILSSQFGIPYKSVKSLADKYGSPDILIQKLQVNPYILTEIDGYGFVKADELALKMGIEKNSPYRITSCIDYILDEEANNGHCWIRKAQLINKAIKLLEIKMSDIEEIFSSINNSFVEVDGIVYNQEFYQYELNIKNNIMRLLASDTGYTIEEIEEKIMAVELKQGFEFTVEQIQAIRFACTHNVVVVSGKAGTGKTAVIKGIVEVLRSIPNLGYATCALSGKASQRIQESTGLDSYTAHRLLGYGAGGTADFLFDELNPLIQDIIILDEASMVNSKLFYSIVCAIKSGAKFIITGDIAQLEPIGIGNVLVDLLLSNAVPRVELTIVHRQAQKSGILSCANMVREGKKFVSDEVGNRRLGELQDLYFYGHNDSEKVLKSVLQICKKYKGDMFDFQVIVPMKSRGILSSKELNKRLQIIFNQSSEFIDDNKKLDKKEYAIIEGDKVILNGNNYDKMIFNGTIGTVLHIDKSFKNEANMTVGSIVINFEGIGNVSFTTEETKQVDLAYAISIHKSQGSQWKYVVLALDYSSFVLLNRQLTYTGMTRASEALFMPVEIKALQHSIKTDKSTKRRTFLLDLFKENESIYL